MYRGDDIVSQLAAPHPSLSQAIEGGEQEFVTLEPPYYNEMGEDGMAEIEKEIEKLRRDTGDSLVKKGNRLSNLSDATTYQILDEARAEEEEDDISKYSAATSVDSTYRIKYPPDEVYDSGSLVPTVITRILQKYHRESRELLPPFKEPYKRGTLKSHSTSKIPDKPISFYFGVRAGTMHLGDETFSERSRNKQGLAMVATAYVYSFIKHPTVWTARDIDKVLDIGDKLYLRSLDILHLHETNKVLLPEELYDVVSVADKKIKYKIHEPDIAGITRSDDPKIFNLLKGLTLFFKRNRSGVLQTYCTNILIWKQRHYYVFDPLPRNEELYSNENGTSIVAIFYDIPSVLVMLLDRGYIDNWPYIISKITVKKIIGTDNVADDVESLTSEFREESNYKIVNPEKAVICGSFSIGDDCFDLASRNKQGLAISTIALVYSHVTPSCAWHKRSVDKIMMVGNQFFLEIVKELNVEEMKLEHVPAFFTIGPLMFEILIYANQYAGLMYKKTVCLFQELILKFFESNSSAIVDIEKNTFAIWRQRDMYYMFDPYPRDREGLKVRDGVACVSMNASLSVLVNTVVSNYSVRDYIFKIHVLKVVKINRDPQFGKLPKSYFDSEESIIDSIKVTDKPATKTNKQVTVDMTEFAMHNTAQDEPIDPSILEVGSFVGSLDKKYIPIIPRCPSKVVIQFTQPSPEKICDLDSPSLSDTQIEKDRPTPQRLGSMEFTLLEEILREQAELDELMALGDGEGGEEYEYIPEMDDDYGYDMKDEQIQKGRDYELGRASAQINTDLLGLSPLPRIVLEPNSVPRRLKKRRKNIQEKIEELQAQITQSKELLKKTNYISLPDDSQIMYGTFNVTQIGQVPEETAPYVCLVANVMAEKYTLSTWSKEVIDFILDGGRTLKKLTNVGLTDVPTIEIPVLEIGNTIFNVKTMYLFDSLLEPTILTIALEKLVFRKYTGAVITTQNYAAAVFLKYHIYYMFDPFGCNLVGLGEGPDNTGVACMVRFKNINDLIQRFMYNKKKREQVEPTEATRFIINVVQVKNVPYAPPPPLPRRDKQLGNRIEKQRPAVPQTEYDLQYEKWLIPPPKNKVGYTEIDGIFVIEASTVLDGREAGSGVIKICHFVSICAMIGLLNKPIKRWDTKRMDYVMKMGKTLFGYIDNMNFADKRTIKNLLFDKHFFDVMVKRIAIANPNNTKDLPTGLDYVLRKNKFVIIQFPNSCYVLHQSKKYFHLFDPYGARKDDLKSSWIRLDTIDKVKDYIADHTPEANDTFFFYTVNITRLKRASKKNRVQYKLRITQIKKKKKIKKLKILHESEEWLTVFPTPWSLMKKNLACGTLRGLKTHKWNHWNIEYPNDLFSLFGTLHQSSDVFSPESRNKQTIANCIVAIVMTEIYSFSEWNESVLDSVLKSGDQYFIEATKSIKQADYEIKVEDFDTHVSVFPYEVQIERMPLIEGTMFLNRATQFNLSKALRYFFEKAENRCGIVCSDNGRSPPKYLAFGRIRHGEYFMYDCQTVGPPMFLDKYRSRSYVLRCLTLNRLLYCLTLTLRSGDFFIYYIGLTEEQEQVLKEVNYEGEGVPGTAESAKSNPFQGLVEAEGE